MQPTRIFTSALGPVITRYLALKQALGRRYSIEQTVLTHLDRFLAAQLPNLAELTPETFRLWNATFADLTPTVRRNRMRIVRNLCLYRQRSEVDCFVPDTNGFPKPHEPRRPYVFTRQQILRLLEATNGLRPTSTSPLYGEGLRLAIVLLYTSGIRRGELLRLTLNDYEATESILHIRETKFHKSRLVPLSCSASREMECYLRTRQQLHHSPEAPLLCNRRRGIRHYTGTGLADGLKRLFRQAEVRTAEGRLPRIHDLRHTFAVHALRRWYEAGVDVQSKLPALATYMGHVSVVSTQHYLAWLEPFAEVVSGRFANHCAPFLTINTPEGDVK